MNASSRLFFAALFTLVKNVKQLSASHWEPIAHGHSGTSAQRTAVQRSPSDGEPIAHGHSGTSAQRYVVLE